MTQKRLWLFVSTLGVGFLFLAILSDLLRDRPFFLGWTQIGMLFIGVFLIASGVAIRSGWHLTWLNQNLLLTFGFILLVFISSALIAYLKVDSFNSWRYSSDLFSFNSVINETARGNWGLEFTYGNAFGDHAYFFLILLTPLKYILNSNVVYSLLLSGPFVYLVCSLVFFYATRHLTDPKKAWFLSVIFFLGFGITFKGLFDDFYGMHPDTYTGYLAVSMVALLLWRDKFNPLKKKSNLISIAIIILLILFLIQKEEMALLAIIFFGIVWVLKRTPYHRNLLLLSIVYFSFALLVIKVSLTPFSRTTNSLIDNLINTFHEVGLRFLFIDSNGVYKFQLTYWLVIIMSTVLFLTIVLVSKKWNPYTMSLFLIGIVKMLFSILTLDFHLTSWHNFPGVIMLTGAILLQFALIQEPSKRVYRCTVTMAVISAVCFLAFEIPFFSHQLKENSYRKPLVKQLTLELVKIKEHIDPRKVVALPRLCERPWVDFRYSLYPRGVYWSPVGIADYLVFPVNFALDVTVSYETAPPPNSFTKIAKTENYILYERISLTEEEKINREYFSNFGLE